MSDAPGFESRVSRWTSPDRGASARDPFPRATWIDLVRRTLRAPAAVATDPAEMAWVRAILTEAELALWSAQSAYDRAHSIRVARRVERGVSGTPWSGDSRWPAAALMHDVGKQNARLSVPERIAVNLLRRAIGGARARRWAAGPQNMLRRVGVYLTHGERGAALIREAGGREELAVWAEAHQTHPGGALHGIPAAVAAALIAADRA